MDCASCGTSNRPGARFCGECGRALVPRCPACGSESHQGARFCDACGAPLAAATPDARETRKVVTIVFADLIGSTALHERLDAESARRLMDAYHRAMSAVVEAHGGTVMQLLGDGVLAGFGVPRVAEDDAIRAVRAAVDMQRAFRELARQQEALAGRLGLRVAVHTGEVVARDDRTHVMGDPVNVAARLQQEAQDGEVLVGESTQRLVGALVTLAPMGHFALKGRSERVAAFRVLSLERPAGAPATAFVGRLDELQRIAAVYDAAVATRSARLAVVLGSPGLGKSRLLDEFARRQGDAATRLAARCDAHGGATFEPLVRAFRALLRVDDAADGEALRAATLARLSGDEAERGRIASGVAALLAGSPGSPEETFFVVRRFLAALAARRPLVLAIDDVHWAAPLLLDLIEHLVQWSTDVPLLVLAAARPELRELRSSLSVPGRHVHEVVTLGGLDAAAATRLAATVIGADALPAAVAGRVLAASEGNPLFLGELVRMLVEDGTLERQAGRWTTAVALADLEMPPTIQALLAARIERLRPEERSVLERAAVIGRQFSRAALAELLPREARADLDARLESLRRAELIEPDTGWLLGEPLLRFHHALIRDAAYRRVLKNTRAELHGRFADWLESHAGESGAHDEALGWHLEQAHQLLRELGPEGERGRRFGQRAATYLAAAGRRALARDDLPLAASLLGRAMDRLDAGDPARADLLLDRCEALLSAGDVGPAASAVEELGRFAEAASGRLTAWHTCFAGQLAVLTDPQALRRAADAVAAAAEALTSAGDAAGEAKAHSVHALALGRLGEIGACEAALDRALASARRAGDRRRANAVLAGAPVAALWGPSPVTRASGRCLDVVRVLRITQGAPAVEAVALRCQAVLEALRGRSEAARRMIASSRQLVEELGITQRLLEVDVFAGLIALLEGDAVAAESSLRSACEGLREQGLGIDAAQAAALLGRALLAQGRVAEALAASRESEAQAGDDLKASIAWRGVRAEALARRGEHDAAVTLARAAVEIASATDALLDHADARIALATTLRAAGRRAEAEAEELRAAQLWEAKGATLLAERARRVPARDSELEPAAREHVPEATSPRRCVRENRATGLMARLGAVLGGRDRDALFALLADGLEVVHHPTGGEFGSEGARARFGALLAAPDFEWVQEPLATLGDSLALCGVRTSVSALAAGDIAPAGAIHSHTLVVVEVDPRGWPRRIEIFADDRLGDAIVRLYERHVGLLPDVALRERAAATARSVEAALGSFDVDRFATTWAPAIEYVDHRTLGLGSATGAAAVGRLLRSMLHVADAITTRFDDVLVLRSDGLVLQRTTRGSLREGGGDFERRLLQLWLFGADGLVRRIEWFDADRRDDALARFEALSPALPRSPRRVRANAATANAARMDAAVAARNLDAFLALLADDAQGVHHPTHTAYAERDLRSGYDLFFRSQDAKIHHEPLATLGEALALCSGQVALDGVADDAAHSFGASDMSSIVLLEVDAQGRRLRTEFFALDRLGDAIARLYERHAELLPDGPERVRAAATARSVAALQAYDPSSVAANLAHDAEYEDQRPLGFPTLRGGGAIRSWLASFSETADEIHFRLDDVFVVRPDLLLARWINTGKERTGGGSFERQFLSLTEFDADGLLRRWVHFAPDRLDAALARIDALSDVSQMPSRRVRPNAASAAATRMEEVVARRDASALAAAFAELEEFVEHATGGVFDKEAVLAVWQNLLRAEDPCLRTEALATLGASLALCRSSMSFRGLGLDARTSLGAVAREDLVLVETAPSGRQRRFETFASDHLADAIARLYERHAELLPDGPERVRAAATARAVAIYLRAFEIEALSDCIAPDVEFVDHRTAGLPSVRGREELGRNLATAFEIADGLADGVEDVQAAEPHALLTRWTTSGRDRAGGGRFEWPHLRLSVFGPEGLVSRVEVFDVDRAREAMARFEALATLPGEGARFENAATRSEQCVIEAFAARDWERFGGLFSARFQSSDRRKLMRLELDRDQLLGAFRPTFEMIAKRSSRTLATRGERLALLRVRLEGSDDSVGPSDVEWLQVLEVDERGERLAAVAFDVEDLEAAYAELDARYAAGEARSQRRASLTTAFQRAFAERDWEALRALLAPDLVVEDHRPLGWETLHGPDAYLHALRSLVELSPDVRLRVDHAQMSDPGYLYFTSWQGTREGGAFEEPSVIVCELDASGRIRRFDQYGLAQQGEARARLAALGAGVARDPLRIPPNAATRAMDRFAECVGARDWAGLEALHAPTFVYEDRRPGLRDSGDRSKLLASVRIVASAGVRASSTLLATAGERLALLRSLFTGGEGPTPFETEVLQVVEVDEEGRFVAAVSFEAGERRAASRELLERYFRGEGARRIPEAGVELVRALNDHDLQRLRAALPDDFVFHDHRRTGVGRIGNADAYVASIAAMLEQSPDMTTDTLYHVAVGEHASLTVGRMFGSLHHGGEFEIPFVRLNLYRDGRQVGTELFELEDLELARARFEALRPAAGAALPNAASRARDRTTEAFLAGDWEALRELTSPAFRFDDRRKRALLGGDRELWIRNLQVVREVRGTRLARELIAGFGERLALERVVWTGDAEDGAFESEFLRVTEVDAEGRLAGSVTFDAEDRSAAFAEAQSRQSRILAQR
jgi:class 3 adenylate cyclase